MSRDIRNDAASLSCGTTSFHAPTNSKISICVNAINSAVSPQLGSIALDGSFPEAHSN